MNSKVQTYRGYFYPNSKEETQKFISESLNKCKSLNLNNIHAIIVPHAGFEYSGFVAASAYKQVENKNFNRVILIGPSHNQYFKGLGMTDETIWESILGKVKLVMVNYDLINDKIIEPTLFQNEHSLEIQVPFLQTVLKNFELFPIMLGDFVEYETVKNFLMNFIDSKTLFVISSDLSHYKAYSVAKHIDCLTIEKILNLNSTIDYNDACGADGINIIILLAKVSNWKVKLIKYANSGDSTKDYSAVVGYSSIIFYSE